MFKSGTKVTVKDFWRKDYPQLVADEYTVTFSWMTSSYTWVTLDELPDLVFNGTAFWGHKGEISRFAVKTTRGGLVISDMEYLYLIVPQQHVLDFQELEPEDDAMPYFSGCAVCGKDIETRQDATGILVSGDMVMLPVCSRCCQSNLGFEVRALKPLTYHDVTIDWEEELELYAASIGQPGLPTQFDEERENQCGTCEDADESPRCAAGECPYYRTEDYLASFHPEMYEVIKERALEKLREKYPDPAEQ